MPRKPRFFLPNVPVHVVQRGNNRQPIFFDEADYIAYLGWLEEAARRWACSVHAYVLMTNHVHLLLTPEGADGVSRALQYLGRRYVAYINDTYQPRTASITRGALIASVFSLSGASCDDLGFHLRDWACVAPLHLFDAFAALERIETTCGALQWRVGLEDKAAGWSPVDE